MFTGIIEACGRVERVSQAELVLQLPGEIQVSEGESLAVNGCCLTCLPVNGNDGLVRFDVSPETLARTSLGELSAGDRVNLERCMRADGRFGGHIVQGHVDATGVLLSAEPTGNSVEMRFRVPAEFDRYLIDKGSVAIDGISLTVVTPREGEFSVWVIPHTLVVTNLGQHAVGHRVNVEFDVVAKYVEKLTASR